MTLVDSENSIDQTLNNERNAQNSDNNASSYFLMKNQRCGVDLKLHKKDAYIERRKTKDPFKAIVEQNARMNARKLPQHFQELLKSNKKIFLLRVRNQLKTSKD